MCMWYLESFGQICICGFQANNLCLLRILGEKYTLLVIVKYYLLFVYVYYCFWVHKLLALVYKSLYLVFWAFTVLLQLVGHGMSSNLQLRLKQYDFDVELFSSL